MENKNCGARSNITLQFFSLVVLWIVLRVITGREILRGLLTTPTLSLLQPQGVSPLAILRSLGFGQDAMAAQHQEEQQHQQSHCSKHQCPPPGEGREIY